MEASDIEQIKKSYIYNIATDVTANKEIPVEPLKIESVILQFENYIRQKYPQYWKEYSEGKLYSDKNIDMIISNMFKFSINMLKQRLESQMEANPNKQIILKLLNNQIQSIHKLNSIYEDFKIDSTPLIIYLIGYLLKTI